MPIVQQASPVTEDVESQRDALASYCLQAINAAARRVTLTSTLAAQGVTFTPELTKTIATQNADAVVFARAMAALENGSADLVRWQKAGSQTIYWGVHKIDQPLGFWPVVAVVLVVTGALVATSWWLIDTFGAAAKVTADAANTRARVISELNDRSKQARAQGRVAQADTMDQALAQAVAKEAQVPPASFADSLKTIADGLKNLGTGAAIGSAATAILALVLLISAGGKKSRK